MSESPLLVFGLPSAPWPLFALAFGAVALACAWRESPLALDGRRTLFAVLILALASAGLSSLYFEVYLGGAPRVIDATAYLLEARILETGSFTFSPPEPISLFRGRFLTSPPGDPRTLGVIFPPGYPVVLAAGEALGSYRIVGPTLAALLVVATYDLARVATGSSRVGVAAALFSTLSMALRYHTADTMSHGWSTLLVTVAGSSYLRVRADARPPNGGPALALGLALGWLVATRQLTGLLTALVVVAHFLIDGGLRSPRAFRDVGLFAFGALPGLLLLGLHQNALTGSFLESPQLAYYAASDGPPGCFGLGLGKGCEFEHGDFFRATAGEGLSFGGAARITLRRLAHHCLDIANFEPLAVVAAFGLWTLQNRRLRALMSGLIVAFVLGYAAFYFDGNYPGGGARFFVELLPLEHVALAALLVTRSQVALGAGLSLLGFAFHGRGTHERLDASQGGRPYLTEREFPLDDGARRLLFVESDHALLLGLAPRNFAANGELGGPLVARASGDGREGALVRNLTRANGPFPVLRLDPRGSPSSRIREDLSPLARRPVHRIEAEGLWPALTQTGGWVHPSFPPENCVSRGRALVVHPAVVVRRELGNDVGPPPSFELWVDGPPSGRYQVRAQLVRGGAGCETIEVGEWSLPGPVRLTFEPASFGSLHLDWLEVSGVSPSSLPPSKGAP